MKKTLALLLALVMLVSLMAGCGKTAAPAPEATAAPSAEPVQEETPAEPEEAAPTTQIIIDNVGREVEVPVPLERVVVTHRLNNELIRACGAGDRVIAVDMNTAQDRVYFAEYDPDNTVGKHQQALEMEKVIELDPQVLIVPYNCKYDEIAAELEPFGITVFVLSANKNEDFEHEVMNVGKLFGVEENAQKIIDYFNDQLAAVQEAVKDVEPKTVYAEYLSDYKAEVPFGGPDIFEQINAHNVFGYDLTAESHDGIEVDPEQIIERNPDAIIKIITPASVVGKSGVCTPPDIEEFEATYQMLLERPGFADLTAMKEDRVLVITAFGETAAFGFPKLFYVAKNLYPEALKDFSPDEVWRTWLEDFQHIDNIPGHFYISSEH